MAGTIRKIAQMAHVSPATVSRYFSGQNVVSDELSRRIEEAANTVGYVPNHPTRKSDGVIVVLIPNLEFGYFSESIKEIDREVIRYIRAKNIKVVMLGGAAFDSRCDMVHINDMMAAYEGMKYLLEMGHRKILILTDLSTSISSGFQRLVGCKKAMEEYGLMFSDDMAEYGQLTFEKGYRSMNSALRKKKKFTAVFAFSDETAVGAITALNEHGLKVPEDVSVLGFDGLSISERVVPKLTTIYQPLDKMVEWTLEILCNKSRNREENIEYTLPYKLLERGTVLRREEI